MTKFPSKEFSKFAYCIILRLDIFFSFFVILFLTFYLILKKYNQLKKYSIKNL